MRGTRSMQSKNPGIQGDTDKGMPTRKATNVKLPPMPPVAALGMTKAEQVDALPQKPKRKAPPTNLDSFSKEELIQGLLDIRSYRNVFAEDYAKDSPMRQIAPILHRMHDAAHKAHEEKKKQARKSALAKLTKEEIKILNLR